MRTFRPTSQPDCYSPCRNAAYRTCATVSCAARDMSTPIRRTRSVCCARAVSGHAAAPPSRVMNCASPHSMTSSARAISVAGTSSPSAFAVLRLITSSYLTGA